MGVSGTGETATFIDDGWMMEHSGEFDISLEVDVYNEIEESNEDNNFISSVDKETLPIGAGGKGGDDNSMSKIVIVVPEGYDGDVVIIEDKGFDFTLILIIVVLAIIIIAMFVITKKKSNGGDSTSVDSEIRKLEKERRKIEEIIKIAKIKYYKRKLDEESYRKIVGENQQKLIEIETDMRELERRVEKIEKKLE